MSQVIKADLVESLTSLGFRTLVHKSGQGAHRGGVSARGRREVGGGAKPQMTTDVRVEDN